MFDRVFRARLPDAPQPRGAVVPGEQEDNKADCWIRATKEKVRSRFFETSLFLPFTASRYFEIVSLSCFRGGAQPGMDLPND